VNGDERASVADVAPVANPRVLDSGRMEVLAERDEELRAIATARGALVWIEGDAGLGKTALLDTAVALDGRRVLRTSGEEARSGEAFGVVARLLAAALSGGPGDGGEAARVLKPQTGGHTPHPRARADDTRLFAGAAAPAAALLDGGSAPGPSLVNAAAWALAGLDEPALLVVDDAHWADPASLQVLRRLTGWLDDLPLGLVVAARPEADGLTGHALATLRAAAHAVQRLRPLSAAGVAAVARASPYAEEGVALAEATHGNPLLLRELLATLSARAVPADATPEAIASATGLAASLARLPAEAVPLAEALAVLGADATEPFAAALVGTRGPTPVEASPPSPVHVDAHLATLRSAGLIAPAPSLAFTHAALRATVLARAPEPRVAALHARAAALLEAAHAPAAHVAAHLLHAPVSAHPRAADVLLGAAAEAAALGAPECGAPALRRALAEPLAPARRAAVLLALARAEAAAGAETAGARWEAAVTLLDAPHERAQALAAAADWHVARGRPREAVALLTRAEMDADGELARSLEARRLATATLDPALREQVRPRVEALVRAAPDRPTPGERGLLALLAWEQAHAGEPAERVLALARAALDDGRLLADETADGISLYVAAGALLIGGAPTEEVATLDAALADARARGSMTAFANASFCRGWPLLTLGRVDEAAADFELALGTVRHGWETYVPAARAGLAAATLEREGPDAARTALRLGETRARWDGNPMFASVLVSAASVELATDRPAAALALAEEAGALLAPLGWHGPGHAGWRPVAALAAHALGDRARALALGTEELERARRAGAPRALGHALRTFAAVTGEVASLDEAVQLLAPSEARLEHAYAVVALGEALAREPAGQGAAGRPGGSAAAERPAGHGAAAKRPSGPTAAGAAAPRGAGLALARTHLRDGLDLADRLGARVLASRARAALVAAGGRPRRARLTGPASLTPAERRVADMAATGLSNRAIAEALWVTTKAVEFQLSRAYAKLGVRGRTELGPALADRP
jgi:DNA-binding CsgD family transcriptional regulator